MNALYISQRNSTNRASLRIGKGIVPGNGAADGLAARSAKNAPASLDVGHFNLTSRGCSARQNLVVIESRLGATQIRPEQVRPSGSGQQLCPLTRRVEHARSPQRGAIISKAKRTSIGLGGYDAFPFEIGCFRTPCVAVGGSVHNPLRALNPKRWVSFRNTCNGYTRPAKSYRLTRHLGRCWWPARAASRTSKLTG